MAVGSGTLKACGPAERPVENGVALQAITMKGTPAKDDSLFRRSHPIHFAAASGASDEVKKIILEEGQTALHAKTGVGQNAAHCAASAGQQGVLVVLSEEDHLLLEERDMNGATPMHAAAETGKLGALYFLALRVPEQVRSRTI